MDPDLSTFCSFSLKETVFNANRCSLATDIVCAYSLTLFSYKVERYQEDGSQFTYGIIAVPRYPPASRLSKDIKVALLFTAFDKDADDYLNEVELTMWQAVLKKPEFDDWNVTLQYYSNAYGVKIDSEKGMSAVHTVTSVSESSN